MHSSRMRNARLLPVSPSMHCSRGGGCLLLGMSTLGVSQGERGLVANTPLCGQNSWHMLLKILPFPNFVAGGNNTVLNFEHRVSSVLERSLGVCLIFLSRPSLKIYLSMRGLPAFHALCSVAGVELFLWFVNSSSWIMLLSAYCW